MKVYKYKNKEVSFDVETDGENIIRISLNPVYKAIHSNNRPEIINKLFFQLDQYLSGKRKTFDINFKLTGTEFQKKVWNELRNIPYGEVITYSELAKRINKPKSARAVGGALNKNPLPIILGCHRVIGKNGNLTGYAGGLKLKNLLLKIES